MNPGQKLGVLILTMWMGLTHAADPASISFNNRIQPILSEYCYPCHGPDSATRKPKKEPLRLDGEGYAFKPRDNGKPVIIKGDPMSSELVRRIKATDDDIMPPASAHKTMKPEEIALLEKWIAQGAKYEKHWSLIPPSRPQVPKTSAPARNPIDHFVVQKLSAVGLKLNPEEKKERLLRRLSFDLTGLPPSPEELHQFANDRSETAYEKAADRMLASDASAEHFTRHWLDAARYADTQGIHHDHSRTIWPYRDWVIAAFKSNMPFDQFTLEQMAGDMLPGATIEQRVASGYNRLLPTTGEGGAIPDEYLAVYAKDRVDTTTAVWMGLTAGCATCHDHKFDPITMKDFYALTAFFRNNNMPGLDASRDANTPPLQLVPAKEDRARWEHLEVALKKANHAFAARKSGGRNDFERWLQQEKDFNLKGPAPSLHLPLIEKEGPFRGTSEGKPIEWAGPSERRAGPLGSAPVISGGDIVEGASPSFTRAGKASFGAYIYVDGKPNGALFSRMNKAEGFRGWDIFFSEGRPVVHIADQWPAKALKVTAKQALTQGEWHHLMAVFDGTKQGAAALSIYVDGRKVDVDVNQNNLGSNIVANAPFRFGARSEKDAPADALSNAKVFLQDVRFYNQALTVSEIGRLAAAALVPEFLAKSPEQRTPQETNAVYELFLNGFDSETQKLHNQLAELKSEEEQIRERGATTLIMEEKKDSEAAAHILLRGNYASKGEQVGAATPEALPPMASSLPRNRLGLAQWLLSPEHPLTARVTVNRLWSQLFGIGIVETTEDFGVQGARPVNQPLLDWLAVEFIESKWNLRHIVKTMVMSATYRQSAVISAEKLEKDPLNKLFSRGPRHRLDAEQIRDQALAASGLLVRKVGGPPVRPYQPEGVWEAVAMKDSNTRYYKQDEGEGLYRRSLYTYWKRIAPPPTMEILNAPTREVFCTRRERTDTPLQAFVTMNDPQFVEASRQLAVRALNSGKTFDERLDLVTESLLARRLNRGERAIVRKLEQRALRDYQAGNAAADSLIEVGESKPDPKLEPAELAAWTLVASQIMNLDESLTK